MNLSAHRPQVLSHVTQELDQVVRAQVRRPFDQNTLRGPVLHQGFEDESHGAAVPPYASRQFPIAPRARSSLAETEVGFGIDDPPANERADALPSDLL